MGATLKTDGRARYPAEAYAYAPDTERPSTWKLRLWESPQLKITRRQVDFALAALSPAGLRGNRVQIPAADLPSVKRKVLAAWHQTHKDEDIPSILKHGGTGMTQEELTKKLDTLEQELAKANARADRAEILSKLGDDDRAAFDTLTEGEQEAFFKGDEVARTSILGKAQDAIHKAAEPEIHPEIQKRMDDLQKRFDEEVAKRESAEAIAKAARDAQHMTELTKRAETEFPALPGTAVETAQVLKSLDKLTTEERTAVETLLKSGNACLLQGMKPAGSDAVGKGGEDAWGKIEKRAQALVAEGKATNLAKAIMLVTEQEPALYDAYLKEQPKQTGN